MMIVMTALPGGENLADDLFAMVSAAEPPSLPRIAEIIGHGLDADVTLAGAEDDGDLTRRARRFPGEVVEADGTYAVAFAGGILLAVAHHRSRDLTLGLRRAAQALTALHHRRTASDEIRGELLTELFSTRQPLTPSVRALAAARGLKLGHGHVVIAAGSAAADTAIGDIAHDLGGLGGRHAGTPVAVVPGDDPRRAAGRIAARLRLLGPRVSVCASDPVDPAGGGLAGAFEDARHGLRLIEALGRPGIAATARELTMYRLLFDAGRADEMRAFLDDTLRPLRDYDRDHNADLLATVQTFVTVGGNAARTARLLYIHPNTMVKRLDRIAHVLGPDWQTGPGNLQLRLALHLRSLAEAGVGPDAR
ncbi:PucR family transcriptional regulator [Actinoplanes sp. CA-054009]